ncbi:MAG: YihY/virulence factor BrkB family protein [Chthoniobacteraceae bacterium]
MKKICLVAWRALRRYAETDGEQRAASFAYYALFALFPLMLVGLTVSSQFVDKRVASEKINDFIKEYIPMGPEGEDAVIKTVTGIANSRKPVGIFAVLAVVWGSMGFFHALVRGINRAWGTLEYPWYRLPFKNLLMVGIVASALFIGILAPAVVGTVETYIWRQNPTIGVNMIFYTFRLARLLLPWLVLFYGFTMLYKFAPRRHCQFSEVWVAALFVTAAVQGLRLLFEVFAQNVLHFNKVYGAFGGIVALLMWIYLSGSLIILGGCLCAAQSEVMRKPDKEELVASD